MGDQYNIQNSQIGAVGQNASATNITFNSVQDVKSLNYVELQHELDRVLQHIAATGQNEVRRQQMQAVQEVIVVSKEGNGEKVQKALKALGGWLLDIAKEVGAQIVANLIVK